MGDRVYFHPSGAPDNGSNRTVSNNNARPFIQVTTVANRPGDPIGFNAFSVNGGSYDEWWWSGTTVRITGQNYVAMRGGNPGTANNMPAYGYLGNGTLLSTWTGGMGGYLDWYYVAPTAPNAPSASRSSNGTSLTATTNGGSSNRVTAYDVALNGVTDWSANGTAFSVNAHTTYSVIARARNEDGSSGNSGTTTSYGIPTAPQSPSATRSTSVAGRISVSWTAPSYTGAGINYYHVYRNSAYLGQYTSTSINDDGLTRGTTYSYTVYANNSTGWSPISSTASAVAPGVPSAPGTPSVTSKVGRTLTINSARTSSDYGNSISEYRIQLSTDDGATWKGWDNTSKTFTANNTYNTLDASGNFTYQLLTPALTYKWRTYAVNSIGTGDLAITATGTFVGAGGKRYTGTAWEPTATSKRFDGTNWVDFTTAKRYDGTTWVDLT